LFDKPWLITKLDEIKNINSFSDLNTNNKGNWFDSNREDNLIIIDNYGVRCAKIISIKCNYNIGDKTL
jgi:hypothetical protein